MASGELQNLIATLTQIRANTQACIKAFSDMEETANESPSQPLSASMSSTVCPDCKRTLSSASSLQQHRANYCRYREGKYAKQPRTNVVRTVRRDVEVNDTEFRSESSCLRRVKVALNGYVRDYEMVPVSDVVVVDPERWMRGDDALVEELHDVMTDYVVKARMVLKVWFVKQDPTTGVVLKRELFYLSSLPSSQIVEFHEWYHAHVSAIMKNFNTFTKHESNLEFDGVEALIIKFSLNKNLTGRAFFDLPQKLKAMKAVINVDAKEGCFKYALLSVLHYKDVKLNRERVSKYQAWENELDFSNVDINNIDLKKDLPKIEKQNNLKINVHVWDKGLQGCRYNRRSTIAERTVNLLLVVNSDGERHYCGIPSLSRLYHHTKTTHNMDHMCERCIRSFSTEQLLTEHFQWCSQGRLQIESMPKNQHYSYTSFDKELSTLRVLYADIESYIQEDIHYPAAIASYEVWHPHLTNKQNNVKLQAWQGEESIINFLQYLEDTAITQHRRDSKLTRQSMLLTTEQQKEFDACTTCPRCKSTFDTEKHKKVRDHCHITGKYRSPLCHACNCRLHLRRRTLPVIFHNFKCYDAHMIIKHGIGQMKDWKLNVIPQTTEKYMSLTASIPVDKTKEGKPVFFNINFIDSYQFMTSSLASLVNNLDDLPFTNLMKQTYPSLSDQTIRRKGVFPYSYFDSLERLQETSLPPRSEFTNDLTGDECSEEEYRIAQTAWLEFGCQTFGDYLMRYLEMDVRQLADVFERFRKVSLEQDGLDPVHFISLPGLSYTSAFKMTKEKIHLLTDYDMYEMFERGIRGGMTFVNKHYIRSGIVTHNNEQHAQHLAYIDQNNLYGSSLSQPLPHSEFSWVEDLSSFTPDFIMNIDEKGDWGYTFELDLSYPSNIHHKTKDFPLAPESGEVTEEMFTPFMSSFYRTLNPQGKYKPCRKLLLTHFNREHYVVHYAILKFYLQQGMVIDKIHKIIKYRQKAWLKPYIDFNSNKRATAQNNFEKDYYKLKNNALFGKTMEDVRKRIIYKLITDTDKLTKLISSPFFHERDIITEDIVGVHMLKSKVTLDKPIFVGQSVLDYSKLEMYKLFYEILPQCSLIKDLKLVGGDTDSFFLTISTDTHITLSDVFNSLAQHIDTSNYPPSHPLYSTVNKAKLGCFKDETAGRELEEMILLRPKMYSMKFANEQSSIKRAKGISRHLVKKMKHDAYLQAYDEKKITHVQMTILRSTQHTVQTTTFRKRALSAWEDKRLWLSENESVPHGFVDSPVPPPKRIRVLLPPSGDV